MNEYYTSKKCPKCQQFVAQTESIRRLYCGHCKKYMHRDVMAANNIVNILRSHVEQQQRPLYLHPVDKDGHYPWLERGDKSAVRPEDARGPSQQASSSGSGRAGRKRQAEDGDTDKEKAGKRVKATVAKQKATTTKGKATVAKQKASTTKGKAAASKQMATAYKGKANAMHVDSC